MANRDCNGDFFEAGGKRRYCCLWNSEIVECVENGQKCPICDRIIKGSEAGHCEIVTVEFVVIPKRGRIEITKADVAILPTYED